MTATTLFSLKTDAAGAFDGGARGIAVARAGEARQLKSDGAFRLNKGSSVQLARHADLDALQTFTLEAVIRPKSLGAARRNIMEAQSPAVALFVEDGKLVGSVHTEEGWVSVDSGARKVEAGEETRVAFTRDDKGRLRLLLDGKTVGRGTARGELRSVGEAGFTVGAWVDGKGHPFVGEIRGVEIARGAENRKATAGKLRAGRKLARAFKRKTGLGRVQVHLAPNYGNSRLQPIKDIVNAAGVQKLSDLQVLDITARTVMTPGKVIVAAKKAPARSPNWAKVAKDLTVGSAAARRTVLAGTLANRNSAGVLGLTIDGDFGPATASPGAAAPRPPGAAAAIPRGAAATISRDAVASAGAGLAERAGAFARPAVGAGPMAAARPAALDAAAAAGTTSFRGEALRGEVALPAAMVGEVSALRRASESVALSQALELKRGELKVLDPGLLARFEGAEPALWAMTAAPARRLYSLRTIPIDSAVMIGQTIDLTNTELVIEPTVATLYLIAERLICGPGAKITWRRPGGSTPARLDDADLNGRGWSGIHTKTESRDGLDGEDGRAGVAGLEGADGLRAPKLEIWVKDLSAMPDLDLNGEDGRRGGRGQRGGRGGNGANGAGGKRAWFFGWHCTSDPGDGGDGGDGGFGGRGGRGGDGGAGGKISIGVLEDTLEETVTSRAFKIKNQGGEKGRGGQGGAGGLGGSGGRSGVGETCKDADDGHGGARGQPGAAGSDGSHAGYDGELEFMEFTEDEWDALLTRPWIAETSPSHVFPGDRLTLRGSRFALGDAVVLDGTALPAGVNPDESLSVDVPIGIAGGIKTVFVRRQDGTESNRLNIWVKPQLGTFAGALTPGAVIRLSGRAFLAGAAVLVDGDAAESTRLSATSIEFTMPGTGGAGSSGGSATLQVRNPDGLVSNLRAASIPRVLEIPFRYGQHNLSFPNFTDGVPDWGTFEDTYGAAEVWHELLDPVFGHPVLTAGFFVFYQEFLKGTSNGGLATGFCTSLASLVADRFWQGHNDAPSLTKLANHKFLTGLHGKLLSRESLIHFHDQGRTGLTRVEITAREIEATFLRGADRHNAPLLFFIPSGAAWDAGYFDRLSDSHCILPYRFVYPQGHPGPQLAPGGATTISDLDGVEMFCWDCNRPENPDCRVRFFQSGGALHYEYINGGSTVQFSSADGVTLGMMTNGAYNLSDHDLPFAGPFGLTRFVLDFLLSPADLQITDENGLRAGNFGGQILSEIPGSLPCYLLPKAYMLPEATALTRRITGTEAGTYAYHSLMPDVGSVALEGVTTATGQTDVFAASADGTQMRFTPAAAKTFSMTMARQVGDEARAIAVQGAGGAPAAEVDVTISPDLSVARIGNRGAARNVEVRAFTVDKTTNAPVNRTFANVNLPAGHDLVVAVQDWPGLNASVQALAFE